MKLQRIKLHISFLFHTKVQFILMPAANDNWMNTRIGMCLLHFADDLLENLSLNWCLLYWFQ